MNSTGNGDKENSEKKAPVNGSEPSEVTELRSRLARLLDTLKEAPEKTPEIAGGDAKLGADFLKKAESLCEELDALREASQEGKVTDTLQKEDLPVSDNPPALSETKLEKEEPSSPLREAATIEPATENTFDRTESMTQTAEPSSEPLFTGEMKLIVIPPAKLGTVLKLYNYLQSLPDIKVVYTDGARDVRIVIRIAVDKPTPVINLISKVGGVILATEDTPDESAEEKTKLLLEKRQNNVKEIRLICRD